uniref:EF-hand domain-containing protein n=1 Tax=Heterorhabditis bacteriophora TaxID=37862 RepID=A0A1I7W7D8_HETBA
MMMMLKRGGTLLRIQLDSSIHIQSLICSSYDNGCEFFPTLISSIIRLDRNASHQVDWGDFYMVVKKVRDIYGADSVQTEFAKKSLAALWEELCKLADNDEDQLISIEEWIGLLKKTDPKKEPKWFKDYNNFMFKLFDVSHDGLMDLAEYSDGMNTYGFSSVDCDEAFRKFSVVS